jgi:chaperonin GroEL
VIKKLKLDGDEKLGAEIVFFALKEPISWLAKNAGDDEKVVLKKVEDSKDSDYGYNALTGEFGSMSKMGIVDPVKVTRSALQNAASVAKTVLTTEGLVTELPSKEDKTPAMPSGMDY